MYDEVTQCVKNQGKTTSVFSDFRRACFGRDHNCLATGEDETPSATFLPTREVSGKESGGADVMRSCGSRSVVAPLGQAQRKRKAGEDLPSIRYRKFSSKDPKDQTSSESSSAGGARSGESELRDRHTQHMRFIIDPLFEVGTCSG